MADDRNFSFKFVGWASFIKDIMRTLAISAVASGSVAVDTSMSEVSTEWTARGGAAVFLRMPEAPAFLALAGRRSIRSHWDKFTS